MSTRGDPSAALPPSGPPDGPAPTLSVARELVTVAFGTWLVVGLFFDGWAHIRRRPEAFLTPFHAVLYSGFALSAWWATAQVRPVSSRRGRNAPPAGYGPGVVGVAIFLAGGVADFAWHSVFGIEVGLEALLSPSHLLLFVGGLLVLTSPIRAALRTLPVAPSFTQLLPGLLSLSAATAVVAFFLMYLSPFLTTSPTPAPYQEIARGVPDPGLAAELAEQVRIRGVASLLVTSLVLTGPCLLLLRRFRVPFGAIAVLFSFVGLLVAGLDGFDHPEGAAVMALAGLAADLLARRLFRRRDRAVALWAFGAGAPVVLWTLYFGALAGAGNLEWPVELWAGATVLSGLAGLGLALVVAPPGPSAEWDDPRTSR